MDSAVVLILPIFVYIETLVVHFAQYTISCMNLSLLYVYGEYSRSGVRAPYHTFNIVYLY